MENGVYVSFWIMRGSWLLPFASLFSSYLVCHLLLGSFHKGQIEWLVRLVRLVFSAEPSLLALYSPPCFQLLRISCLLLTTNFSIVTGSILSLLLSPHCVPNRFSWGCLSGLCLSGLSLCPTALELKAEQVPCSSQNDTPALQGVWQGVLAWFPK